MGDPAEGWGQQGRGATVILVSGYPGHSAILITGLLLYRICIMHDHTCGKGLGKRWEQDGGRQWDGGERVCFVFYK